MSDSKNSEAAQTRPDSADSQRFMLQSQTEIVRVLRALMQNRAIVTGNLDGGKTMLVTAVLLVEPKRNLVVLDYSPNPKINERVLVKKKLYCISSLDHIEVKFTLHDIVQARLEGQPVFRASLPQSVYYPQRRRFYRLVLSRTSPLGCVVKTAGEGGEKTLDVIDLSVGGLGLIDHSGEPPPPPGSTYPGCHLDLPELGRVSFDLEVRATLEVPGQKGDGSQRLCCAFHNLRPDHAALIQRFINQQQIKMRQAMPDSR